MKTLHKYIVGYSFLAIVIQYWVLDMISKWFLADDSSAVMQFSHTHLVVTMFAGLIWCLDTIKSRYVLIVFLAFIYWCFFVKQPPKLRELFQFLHAPAEEQGSCAIYSTMLGLRHDHG